MIRIHCEGQGSVNVTLKNKRGGNYVSRFRSSFGDTEFKSVLARDLLRVGQAAFLADRAFRRGFHLGQQTRRLTVVMPVEEPKRWNRIRDRVIKLSDFVSQDVWQFEFTALKRKPSREKAQESSVRNASVNLFSNGLDSLCGAAAAFERGETPIFVSHSPPGVEHVARKIASLQDALGFNRVEPQFVNFCFRVSDRDARGKRNLFPERSRRTRPMLFLSMAGAVALEYGVRKIFLNENGVLAVNLPLQPSLSGPRITRHAHPETLRRFESLLKALWPFDSTPTVRNPFLNETKADQMKALGRAKPLAAKTITCEYAGQQIATLIGRLKANKKPFANTRECGLCLPCLVRRSAMELTGVAELRGHYVFDARRALKNPRAYANVPLYRHVTAYVRDLFEFCERMRKIKPSSFALSYLYELSLLSNSAHDVRSVTRETYRLYTRFARQLTRYLNS